MRRLSFCFFGKFPEYVSLLLSEYNLLLNFLVDLFGYMSFLVCFRRKLQYLLMLYFLESYSRTCCYGYAFFGMLGMLMDVVFLRGCCR